MNILNGIRRFFFQKASSDFDANEAFRRNQLRYNALRALDPNVLVRHLEAFVRGDICGLERVIDEFETREDKMRIGSFKMAAAVSSKPWKVQIRQGEEENPRAKLHREHLTKFWNRVEATDAFCRNRRGGLRLLVKQMMSAQSRVYSVHDICWKVNGDGTLNATFTHVPAWCFENRTGRLRYIRNDSDTAGVEMPDGEWLVTVGEGVGIAAAVIAMAKRLSWNDWLLFSEKCGMPVILGNTNAQRDTPAWAAMSRAIRAIAPKTGLLADTGTTLNAVSMGAGGQQTYRELVDTVDRAISALYRGGDLATQSSGPDAAGVNAQAGESELMDDDGCKMIAETLRDQVEKFVIRFELGDFEPLAEIVINPPADTEDVDREMKIDNHLAGLGVKLSKKDALARYGRTEAEDENDALTPPNPAPQGGLGGLANEKRGEIPLQIAKDALQNAPRNPDGQGDPKPEDALVEALSGLFEKALAEAAAGEIGGELGTGNGEPVGADHRAARAEVANEITNPCPKRHRQMSADGTCTFCEAEAKIALKQSSDKATTHTPEEEKRIKEFQSSTNQDVVDKINTIVDICDNGKPRSGISDIHANFGAVSDKSATRISEIVGHDVSGYDKYFDGSDMLHTWERHGRKGKADQSMADVANFGRAGYVVDHADTIEPLKNPDGTPDLANFLDKQGKRVPKLMARMRVDGTAAAAIVAPDSKKKRIHIISMRIEKSKPADVKHQENLPRPTSETVSTGHDK